MSIKVTLNKFRVDGGTQSRTTLNFLTIDEYAESYTNNESLPAVTAFYDGSDYWLADGFHRLAAAKKAGLPALDCEVKQGTRRDAVLYSVGANASHGLRRSSADKRRAIETLLRDSDWVQWSDREIARRTRTNHKTVGKVRIDLESTGEIPSAISRKTSDGRTMNTRNVGGNQSARPGSTLKDPASTGYFPSAQPAPAAAPRKPKPEIIASAPLASTPEPKNETGCKKKGCEGFGIEWSRHPDYGVGLYCLDCLKVNKAIEIELLEKYKAGETDEAFMIRQLGCSSQTLRDKMDVTFGEGWDKPAAPSLTPPITIKTDRGVYKQPELKPAQTKPTLSPPSLTPPKSPAIPDFKLVLKVSPDTGRIIVTVGEDGSGPLVWNTGKFEDVQMLFSGSLAEFIQKQGKYDGTALYL